MMTKIIKTRNNQVLPHYSREKKKEKTKLTMALCTIIVILINFKYCMVHTVLKLLMKGLMNHVDINRMQ